MRESPLTLPNAITIARIASCPILGYYIIQGQFGIATTILFFSGFSDWVSDTSQPYYSAQTRHWSPSIGVLSFEIASERRKMEGREGYKGIKKRREKG